MGLNRSMFRLVFWIGVVCAGVLLGSVTQAQTELPAVIAVIAAKTGDASPSNLVLFQAARFAVEEINQNQGLLGRQVKILELDNQSTSIGSKIAAEKAVKAEVLAVIGASWSEHSQAMAPVLEEARIPMITPISTNPKVTRSGSHIFRVCFTDAFQGRVMAQFARENLNAQTAVTLVNVSRTYSVDLAAVFQQTFEELGGKILWKGRFLLDSADFKQMIRNAKFMNPDVIYIPGDYRDSSFIIKQIHHTGWQVDILGGDAFGLRLYDYIGKAAEGCYYTTHWHRDSPLPSSRDFVARYESVHGKIRQTTIPLTYDAVMLWADAVRRAGSLNPEKVQAALAATSHFQGVTGQIAFDQNGDPIKPVVINRLENLDISFVRNVDPHGHEPQIHP